jgi:glycosyltransferase involved in cell wall biosynthesis/GT2 family glycosyltransferase
MGDKTLSFSVVINTYNRAKYLEETIRGLIGIDNVNMEIIVVNGPSDDGTDEILERWRKRVRIVSCPEINLSMSRNAGIDAAAGDIVAFIDDDAVPHPSWLKNIAPHYSQSEVAGVGGFTIDNTGRRFQVRKTVCDRFGNAYNVSEFFDERALNSRNSPFYPSLLGTNSTFRRKALEDIGGFDHVFAYFLDETDVCLRLVDAGHKVVYEPSALVFHQFAPSHLRNSKKIPRTLYPSARSKSYFIFRHGGQQNEELATEQLKSYREEILRANKWLADHGEITFQHRTSLDQDFLLALQDGRSDARKNFGKNNGNLERTSTSKQFKPIAAGEKLRVALVSQGYPPQVEAGIARWTSMIADGLVKRGVQVHIITSPSPGDGESTHFEQGRWFHRVHPAKEGFRPLAVKLNLPENISAWTFRVWQEVQAIKTFGLNVVSFPIWDLEGISMLDDKEVGVVMSLHTSYAMAKPFKPEWNARPIYEYFMVDKMISAEAEALRKAPLILANSNAIVRDLFASYKVDFLDRTVVATHGTDDILSDKKIMLRSSGSPLRVLYVGRFEPRKGFDIAVAAASLAASKYPDLEFTFLGGQLDTKARGVLDENKGTSAVEEDKWRFVGVVNRQELEQAYRDHDVVVMPSRYESFGLVAIESMSAGTPVIALNSGGLGEVVEDNVSGFLVADDEGAKGKIADLIVKCNENRELLHNLSKGARRAFEERFTIDKMVDEVLVAYRKAAAKGKIA